MKVRFFITGLICIFWNALAFSQFGLEMFPAEQTVYSITGIDADNDGDEDIVYGGEDGLFQMENLGFGNFGPGQLIWDDFAANSWPGQNGISWVYLIREGDLDGDGLEDIIVAYGDTNDPSCSSCSFNVVAWFKNLVGPGFGPIQELDSETNNPDYQGERLKSLSVFDLEGDSDLDIIFTRVYGSNSFRTLINLGGASSWQSLTESPGVFFDLTNSHSVLAVDLDNNSVAEIVYGSYENILLKKNQQAGYDTLHTDLVWGTAEMMAFDFDGDNDLDILARISTGVNWFENLGNLNFAAPQVLAQGDFLSGFSADFDNDGFPDLVVRVGTTFGWLKRLMNGEFSFIPIYQQPSAQYGADFDNDGDVDLIGPGQNPPNVYYYENFMSGRYSLSGETFYDLNQNKIHEPDEPYLSGIKITIDEDGFVFPLNGQYEFSIAEGWHQIAYESDLVWVLTTDSSSYNILTDDNNPVYDNLDFGFFPNSLFTQIEPVLTGAFPRCNDEISYWINLQNTGTSLPSGVIALNLHPAVSFSTSEISPDSIIGQTIYWHYDSLSFFGLFQLNIQVQMPSVDFTGDSLNSILTVYELDELNTVVYSVSDTLQQVLACAYDPNDKLVEPTGTGEDHFIDQGQILDYTIRFQNTGTDTAFNVMVRDQLSEHLEPASFEFLGSSHEVEVWIEPRGEVVFKFDNIMLPDSNINERESHGFVRFRVGQREPFSSLAVIENKSEIYFDLNPAVVTNTVLNTVCPGQPNEVNITLGITGPELSIPEIPGAQYQWYYNDELIPGANSFEYIPEEEGWYKVEISDQNNCYDTFFTNEYLFAFVSLIEAEKFITRVYPNPSNYSVHIVFSQPLAGDYDLMVFDLIGRPVYSISNITGTEVSIQKPEIGEGVFFVNLVSRNTGEVQFASKIFLF